MTKVTTAQEQTSHFKSIYRDTGNYNQPKLHNLSISTATNTSLKMLLPPHPIIKSQYLTNKDHKSTHKTFKVDLQLSLGKIRLTQTPLCLPFISQPRDDIFAMISSRNEAVTFCLGFFTSPSKSNCAGQDHWNSMIILQHNFERISNCVCTQRTLWIHFMK